MFPFPPAGKRRRDVFLAVLSLTFLALLPGDASAGCAADEVVATLLFSGDLANGVLTFYRLSVVPVDDITNPTDEEIRGILATAYPSVPGLWTPSGVPPIRLWNYPPLDFGAEAFVDDRTGEIVFLGTVVFAGQGHVLLPATTTHPIGELGSPPADPPTLTTLANEDWDGFVWPSTESLAATAVEWLRSTDLAHAFAACSPPWDALGRVYTPTIGGTNPDVAEFVLVVRGRPGPPWSPVATEAVSWGRVKARWR